MPRLLLKVLKWAGIVLGGLLGLLIAAIVVVYFIGGSKLSKTYDIEVVPIPVPTDEVAIERGRHLVEAVGLCQECHGERLEGKVMEEDPVFGRFSASNLTAGKGGVGGRFSDVDYVRAIRHGVRPDGTPLIIMPSEFFTKLGGEDVGAIIAYLKSLPPVDNEVPVSELGPLGRLFLVMGAPFLPAAVVDHAAPVPDTPEPAVTAEYGKYVGLVCTVCHGDDLAHGEGQAAGPNITQGGTPGKWSEADFIKTIRTGVTPRGHALDAEQMFWKRFAKMTDDELKALWLYLKSVPAVKTEG